MMERPSSRWGPVGFSILVGGLVACDNGGTSGGVTQPGPPLALNYIGSEACGFCHTQIYNEFIKSGHPYKLNKVENGTAPFYPFSEVPNPPAGFTWDDVTYVIGGFGWKARFIGRDGYIITQGGNNQYNLATGGWVDYHKDQQKPYDCGSCHTTAYRPDGHQDGLPGIIGQWAFPGIQCEECHGPGSAHAQSPPTVPMSVDTRATSCGQCHNRGGLNADIPASGGFIRHHEQYNELLAGGHKQLECVTCHDPHTGTKYNDQEGAQAIVAGCEDCHTRARSSLQSAPLAAAMGDLPCESCHMPFADKSAVKNGVYVGDLRSHLVKINADVNAEPFSGDGKLANPYLTLEYACLGCHTDEDKAWAAQHAPDVHGVNFNATRVPAALKP